MVMMKNMLMSFYNANITDDTITICHKNMTKTISYSKLDTHLDLGDYEGEGLVIRLNTSQSEIETHADG